MELEKTSRSNDNYDFYDFYFYATVCHVCKRFGDGVTLKRCGGCGMIAYCGRKHQKHHWKRHKLLCHAIQDVLREHSMEGRDVTVKKWKNMKLNFMLLVSFKLGRRLERSEMEVLMFPRECEVCHERNARLLEDCQDCLSVSFCNDHRDSIEHKEFCYALKLCFHLNLMDISGNQFVNLDYLQHVSKMDIFRDMNEFISTYVNTEASSEMSSDILAARHSHNLSRPLTVYHAMRLLDYIPERFSKDLIIHVVGANVIEESTLPAWEVLLHLIEPVISLVIVLIGPELICKSNSFELSTCDSCISGRKKISLDFRNMLYENYACSQLFVRPDLIVGFDIGLQEWELKSTGETWSSSIEVLAKQNCPFILTCYKEELEEEIERLNTILNRKVDYLYSGKNPFASLRPQKNFGAELVFYSNYCLTIYESLYS
ncbi:uncharacterized protein LOC105838120 [Monomorium pharaonis]|uniref:uncharacterized protein LOC105838120 n=1 Tax=Monomorium pharaonis TaxID=307658 RepID=UPI00063F08D2|nr:uncharacterized protein LOC105838120 [Monomorium pharaonis]